VNEQSASGAEAPRLVELRSARELEQIPGVLAAAVWMGSQSSVREVYIAAAPDAAIGEIRRMAAEVLGRNGLTCTPDAIQLGIIDRPAPSSQPTETDDAGLSPVWQGRFLVLTTLHVQRADNGVTCHVEIQRLGESFSAEARELDTPTGRARAAARAALIAAQLAAPGVELGLEGLIILEAFGRRYVALSIEAVSARRFTHLSGFACIDRSAEDAACFATLGAIERWIAW
jgi:hypothetical protein